MKQQSVQGKEHNSKWAFYRGAAKLLRLVFTSGTLYLGVYFWYLIGYRVAVCVLVT